jgi:mono/diheme cytochrome c family protein
MRLLPLTLALTGCTSLLVDPMEAQPRAAPYGHSEAFANGLAMQAPPPGTVSRDATDLPEAPEGDGGVLGGPVPLALTQELLQKGQHQFDIICATCHGLLGTGVSVVASKMALRPPPSLQTGQVRALQDGQLFTVITDGYGLMPSFRARLSSEERWAVVAYLRALQLSQAVPRSALSAADVAQLPKEGTP